MKFAFFTYPAFFKFILFTLNLGLFQLEAQNNYSAQSSHFSITGTSTVHNWEVTTNTAKAVGNFELLDGHLKAIKSFWLEIAGNTIKSSNKSGKMDEKIVEALKSNVFPTISFKLNELTSYPTAQNGMNLSASGVFNIAGFSKNETISGIASIPDSKTIILKGQKRILMTDYQIQPPKAMMGMLTTGNEVNVTFEVVMKQN